VIEKLVENILNLHLTKTFFGRTHLFDQNNWSKTSEDLSEHILSRNSVRDPGDFFYIPRQNAYQRPALRPLLYEKVSFDASLPRFPGEWRNKKCPPKKSWRVLHKIKRSFKHMGSLYSPALYKTQILNDLNNGQCLLDMQAEFRWFGYVSNRMSQKHFKNQLYSV